VDERPVRAAPRPAHTWTLLELGLITLFAVVGCDSSTPRVNTPAPIRPAVEIDGTWTATNDEWTFAGRVDPQGDPTDVVLEVGPGPSTARRFDAQLPVAQSLTEAGPVTITTREIPDVDEICVRFTATNTAGRSSSTPLCIPHDLPSILPPAAPTIKIDQTFNVADGQWTFTGRLDPGGEPTDVFLDVGSGPATGARFDTQLPVAQDLAEVATLAFTTADMPEVDEICVRFTATNSLGTSSSAPLCFPREAGSSPGSSPTPGAS
jgi:hypothetical protein